MGTDIHFFVEFRNAETAPWQSADDWQPSKYTPGEFEVPYGKEFYNNRSYDLFAILANVRNGHGFAGIKTGEGFQSIAQPRGLPNDMSSELTTYATNNLEHTPSHLTLAEILAFDWTQTTIKCGWIIAEEWLNWCGYNRYQGYSPKSWCGEVGGGRAQKINEKEAEELLQILGREEFVKLQSTYIFAQWTVSYSIAAKEFWHKTIPKLLRLGTAENVRVVFWFDS